MEFTTITRLQMDDIEKEVVSQAIEFGVFVRGREDTRGRMSEKTIEEIEPIFEEMYNEFLNNENEAYFSGYLTNHLQELEDKLFN